MAPRILVGLMIAGLVLAQNPEQAKFPAEVATDADLLVAKDDAWSTLNGGIDASTLSVVVWDGSRFASPSVVKIRSEFLKVCSIATNTLTICTGGRGFAGTTPASHSSGVLVEDVWMAKHHNLMAAEIAAIQAALGAGFAKSGNTNTVATASGALTDGNCVQIDAAGNITDAGAPCGTGEGGAGQVSDLTDCKATRTAADIVTIAAPCRYRIGGDVFALAGDATATLSGSSASGTVYFYWNASGQLVADENTAATLECNGNCVSAETGGFPVSAYQVATATFTASQYDLSGVTDRRTMLGRHVVEPGSGIASSISGGVQTISTDPLEVPRFFSGTDNPPTQNCTAGRDFYANTAANKQWSCTSTNTWTELTGGGSSLPDQANNAGKVLTTDGSAAAWTRPLDYSRYIARLHDHFLGYYTGTGPIYALGWRATSGPVAMEAPFLHPGTAYWTTAASANSAESIRGEYNTNQFGALGSNAQWEATFVLRTDTYGTSGNQIHYRMGFTDVSGASIGDPPANWFGLRYVRSTGCTNNGSDTYWTFESRAASSSSVQASAVAATDAQWIAMRVRSYVAGTLLFSISADDGATWSSDVSISTNVPTVTLTPFFQVVTCDSGTKRLHVDLFNYEAWR